MDEDEAALLAELRAISARSTTRRFVSEDQEATDGGVFVGTKKEHERSDGPVKCDANDSTENDAKNEQLSHSDLRSKDPSVNDGAEAVPHWKEKRLSKKDKSDLPPWKREKTKLQGKDTRSDVIEVVPVEPAKATNLKGSVTDMLARGGGFKSSSKFSGERGGTAEDAELLAELRAISSKSKTSDRFKADDTNCDTGEDAEKAERQLTKCDNRVETCDNETVPPWKRGKQSKNENTELQPWKRKGRKAQESEARPDDVVVQMAVPNPPSSVSTGGGGCELSSTFSGERGGTAEDAELLAELRAISSKSKSLDRFTADDVNCDTGKNAQDKQLAKCDNLAEPGTNALVPPWKRGKQSKLENTQLPPGKRKGKKAQENEAFSDDVVVQVAVPKPPSSAFTGRSGFKASSTFSGERGGTAEDAELLVELKAISSKSKSSDRFTADDTNWDTDKYPEKADKQLANCDNMVETGENASCSPFTRGKQAKKETTKVPPWKRKGREEQENEACPDDVVVQVAVPKAPSSTSPGTRGGFKSCSTFSGERGGTAKDAELLAELRAISSKSKSVDRFTADDPNCDTDKGAEKGDKQLVKFDDRDDPGEHALIPPWKRGKQSNNENTALRPEKRKGIKAQEHKACPDDDVVQVAVSKPPSSALTGGSGFKSSSTFSGERGGTAEDAELLAELRAISSKSKSADRFTADDPHCDRDKDAEKTDKQFGNCDNLVETGDNASVPPWKRGKQSKNENTALRPEKRKGRKGQENEACPSDDVVQVAGGGFKLSSTFSGERGGTAEDVELLAELRAISSKSKSSDRFTADDINCDTEKDAEKPDKELAKCGNLVETGDNASLPPWKRGKQSKNKNTELPPWKRKGRKAQENEACIDDVVVQVAEPETPSSSSTRGDGFKSSSTFSGERGGTAEDAELLAELRAISSKSNSLDRFVADDTYYDSNKYEEKGEMQLSQRNNLTETCNNASVSPRTRSKESKNESSELPPGKTKGRKAQENEADPDDVVVQVAVSNPPLSASTGGGFKSSSTFSGERGGPAEDAELLAELRAISSKSKSKDRFTADDVNCDIDKDAEKGDKQLASCDNLVKSGDNALVPPWQREKQSKNENIVLPPWKRKGRKEEENDVSPDDVVVQVAVPKPPFSASTGGNGFKSSSTFSGERGGTAEDAELLAELRAISSKSNSLDRFTDDDTNFDADKDEEKGGKQLSHLNSLAETHENASVPPPTRGTELKNERAELPPWKRKGRKAQENEACPDDVVVQVAVPNPVSSATTGGGGFKSSPTFSDERGGTAEDAELLAQLRSISSKSKSLDRFTADNVNCDTGKDAEKADKQLASCDNLVETGDNALVPPWKHEKQTKNENTVLPPWKRKGRMAQKNEACAADLVVEVAVPKPPLCASTGGNGFKSYSKFSGERGGTAEDADLLAELRAISSKSRSLDRFTEDDTNFDTGMDEEKTDKQLSQRNNLVEPCDNASVPSLKRGKESKNESSESPPWKRKGRKFLENEACPDDVVVQVAVPNPPSSVSTGGGFESSSTFSGERGGPAEDAELLAELRAISSKSKSKDRFTADDVNCDKDKDAEKGDKQLASCDNLVESGDNALVPPWKCEKQSKNENTELPPWKRKGRKLQENEVCRDNVVVQVAGAKPPSSYTGGGFFKSSSTFSGERGGTAEDAELLAELRAISSKSKNSDRFASDVIDDKTRTKSTTDEQLTSRNDSAVIGESSSASVRDDGQPAKRSPETKDELSSPPQRIERISCMNSSTLDGGELEASEPLVPVSEGAGGFKSTSSFRGQRGGSAEDAELLAELRAISSKSNRTSLFLGDDTNEDESMKGESTPEESQRKDVSSKKHVSSLVQSSKHDKQSNTEGEILPPRTRKGKKPHAYDSASDASIAGQTTAAPSFRRGEDIKTSASNFKGERGGAAEDAELLSELKAISASRETRFSTGDDESENASNVSFGRSEGPDSNGSTSGFSALPTHRLEQESFLEGGGSLPDQNEPTAPLVTFDDMPGALSSKFWKERKGAYELLTSLLMERVEKDNESCRSQNKLEANSIIESLDELVPSIVKDSNAVALDAALDFGNIYADQCSGACVADQASKITLSLVKGSALSSSRPSTVKKSKSLLLKLMEVGNNGPTSIHSVVEALLSEGLRARKPKLVITSATLVLESARAFGASFLPLVAVSECIPKMLSHANANVRDCGMNIMAEICRAVGSKAPLQSVVGSLKNSQVAQLDKLLDKQKGPSPPSMTLRFQTKSDTSLDLSPENALAVLNANAKELEAKKFASRPAVNVLHEMTKTEYASKIKLEKWSEKVAALDIVLTCGGEKPYKLAQPSNTINYGEFVSELKRLLSHSHFAVNSKAMAVFTMLAEGVGDKLFSQLRPLLPTLLDLSKDKKLTVASGKCLDSFFGNVLSFEHLLDKEDAILSGLDEKKQKNALARISALAFLRRCIERNEAAGARGKMTPGIAKRVATLAVAKLNDNDQAARKEASGILGSLLSFDDNGIRSKIEPIVADLKTSHARVYKSLKANTGMQQNSQNRVATSAPETKTASLNATKRSSSQKGFPPTSSHSASKSVTSRKKTIVQQKETPSAKGKGGANSAKTKGGVCENTHFLSPNEGEEESQGNVPTIEEATCNIQALGVPKWDNALDDGGVLEGLKSNGWKSRRGAIESLTLFFSGFSCEGISSLPFASAVLLVKEHTKGFKESNVMVIKAIMEFFSNIMEKFAVAKQIPDIWICKDAVVLCVDKIADRKLSGLASTILSSICVVRIPRTVLVQSIKTIDGVKSPLAHEALLRWTLDVVKDFGASSLGNGVKEAAYWITKECECSNAKVRKASLSLIGELHVQLGPVFKALLLSSCPDSLTPGTKVQIEQCFETAPFDPNSSKIERPKACITIAAAEASSIENSTSLLSVDIPKTDLLASLPDDCLSRMSSKEGKNAWKIRKEAMEQVVSELEKCGGLVSCAPSCLSGLADLVRALRERMTDSQSNLKPVAAGIIGTLLSSVDEASQAKLGKIGYPPLINAALNDNKKMMREAALKALDSGTTKAEVDGGGPNVASLEVFLSSLVVSVRESEYKAGGLPGVLEFVAGKAEHLPKLASASTSKAQSLEQQLAQEIVACLTSSKVDTRHAASDLVKKCVEFGTLNTRSIQKGIGKLLPAQQRSVAPIVAQIQENSTTEKENSPSSETPRKLSNSMKGPSTSSAKKMTRTPIRGINRRDSFTGSREKKKKIEMTPGKLSESSPTASSASHPLQGSSVHSHSKEERSSTSMRKRENWPEYPEEPLQKGHLQHLKKLWAPLLPESSKDAFFPNSGISKQEEAIPGTRALLKAVEIAMGDDSDSAVIDQLDLIFKWLACSLCSRESTSALQKILSVTSDILKLLSRRGYVMTDFEASLLLPLLLEKGSSAKGRFRVIYGDLIKAINADTENQLYAPQKYGPLICVTVAERSGHGKTRVLAMNECRRCIEQVGLSGIGRRGIFNACKTLSEESLTDNRNAALDVIESVIVKMNGDVPKFFTICSSNLSDKAKSSIKERWSKHHPTTKLSDKSNPSDSHFPVTPKRDSSGTLPNSGARQKSKMHTQSRRTSSPSGLPPGIPLKAKQSSESPAMKTIPSDSVRSLADQKEKEQKSFNLHIRNKSDRTVSAAGTVDKGDSCAIPDGPFTFKYRPEKTPVDLVEESNPAIRQAANITERVELCAGVSSEKDVKRHTARASGGTDEKSTIDSREEKLQLPSSPEPTLSGAAASLRARLRQMRERNAVDGLPKPLPSQSPQNSPVPDEALLIDDELLLSKCTSYSEICKILDNTVKYSLPLPQGSNALVGIQEAVKSLKSSVTSFSESPHSEMRNDVKEDISACVERLTRVLEFSVRCTVPFDENGISGALLSRTTTVLLAIFKEKEFAHSVGLGAVCGTIRQASQNLLDPRLAFSVKVMNKLAIQAAIGIQREKAFKALMSLQLEYCKSCSEGEDNQNATSSERMARITTKLFARIIRAEETRKRPFSRTVVDIEAILFSMEDMLVAVDDVTKKAGEKDDDAMDSMTPCTELARVLVVAILKAYGTSSGDAVCKLREIIDNSGIVGGGSFLGKLLDSCATGEFAFESFPQTKESAKSPVRPLEKRGELGTKPDDTASAVGQPSVQRTDRSFGDTAIKAKDRLLARQQLPMSERIRFLKSKISATEAALQSTVDGSSSFGIATLEEPTANPLAEVTARQAVGESTVDLSSISAESSSDFDKDAISRISIRERLAMAQKRRGTEVKLSPPTGPSGTISPAPSHAAALRARLEAMKQKPS